MGKYFKVETSYSWKFYCLVIVSVNFTMVSCIHFCCLVTMSVNFNMVSCIHFCCLVIMSLSFQCKDVRFGTLEQSINFAQC